MTPLTPAQRKRRERERKRAAADPLRAFCLAVIRAADEAVAAGTGEAWLMNRSADALDLLAAIDNPANVRIILPFRFSGVATADRDKVTSAFLRDFDRYMSDKTGVEVRQRTTERLDAALARVAWAQGELDTGEMTSASVSTGLRAVKVALAERHRPASAQALSEFLLLTNTRDQLHAIRGERYDAERGWVTE